MAASTLHFVSPEQRLDPIRVFQHALPEFEVVLILILMLVATVAAIAVWIVQRLRLGRGRPESLERALAFLTALVTTAPLLGLTIAAYDVMKACIGLANLRPGPDPWVLAPAFAEAMLAVFISLLTAAIASAARGHLLMASARKRLDADR